MFKLKHKLIVRALSMPDFKAIHLIHVNILKKFNSQTDQHRALQTQGFYCKLKAVLMAFAWQ